MKLKEKKLINYDEVNNEKRDQILEKLKVIRNNLKEILDIEFEGKWSDNNIDISYGCDDILTEIEKLEDYFYEEN